MLKPYYDPWHVVTSKEPSKEAIPVVYRTKITKTEVIPLYREANANGETGDIICIEPREVEVLNPTTKKMVMEKNFDFQVPYPFSSILPEDSAISNDTLLDSDMATNCEAFGIVVEDGIKDANWQICRKNNPVERGVPLTMLDIIRLRTKIESPDVPSDPSQPVDSQEVTAKTFFGEDGIGYTLSADKTEEGQEIYYLKDRGRGRPKEFIIIDGKYIGLKEHKAALILASNTTTTFTTQIVDGQQVTVEEKVVVQGKRGRVRVNPLSPELEMLFNAGHRETKCSVCAKPIVIQEAFVEKAKNMGVDVMWLVANYKCRSCGGVTRKQVSQ